MYLKLYHYQELNLTPVQVRGAYIKTSSLPASQGCKEQFIIESQAHADKLIIKDDNDENILSIEVECHPEPFGLAKEINKLHPKPKNISLGDITRLVFFGTVYLTPWGVCLKKTHHILPSYGQYFGGRFTNGFTWIEFLSSPHFLGKEMLNFLKGEVHRQAIPALIASVTLYQIRTDKSYTPSHQDLVIFLLGANDYMTLHKDN